MTPVAELCAIAADPGTPRDDLRRLARSTPMVRHALAANPSCPGDALDVILRSVQVRQSRWGWVALRTLGAVAAHPNASRELIVRLADHPLPVASISVGRNPSAPLEVLHHVMRRWGPIGRAAVAQNPAIPLELMSALARDPVPRVRLGAAQNPSLAGDDLVRMAGDASSRVRDVVVPRVLHGSHDLLRRALLLNGEGTRRRLVRSLPPTTARRLANDDDVTVRRALTRYTPSADVLITLASDPDTVVRRLAGRRVLDAALAGGP